MDIWQNLVQDIKFKEGSGEERKLAPKSQTVKSKALPITNDPLEAANVFRKSNHIRVQGEDIPAPVQVCKL